MDETKQYNCGICDIDLGKLTDWQAEDWYEWWRIDLDEHHDSGREGGGKIVCRDCVADYFENCEI